MSTDSKSVIAGDIPLDLTSRFSGNNKNLLGSVFKVSVSPQGNQQLGLEAIAGRYQMCADYIRFTPHFSFEPGLSYIATFDPSSIAEFQHLQPEYLNFALTRNSSSEPTKVENVYPSAATLPENLLRFYVCFSQPMLRGHAEREIRILGPNGSPVSDALYRPPIELWDRSMRCLTVLLDPGRLKRWVGPNVELGPPLKAGQQYMLEIGSGMLDASGLPLASLVRKTWTTVEPDRHLVQPGSWQVLPPAAQTAQPLLLRFNKPIDRASLMSAIRVETKQGTAIAGSITIKDDECAWQFSPQSPWRADTIYVRLAPGLEDVCGNTLNTSFEQPLRLRGANLHAKEDRTLIVQLRRPESVF